MRARFRITVVVAVAPRRECGRCYKIELRKCLVVGGEAQARYLRISQMVRVVFARALRKPEVLIAHTCFSYLRRPDNE